MRFVLIACLVCASLLAQAQPNRYPRPTRMPAQFSFAGVQGQAISQATLKPGLATVVIFFDPDCDHCQKQAMWLDQSRTQTAKLQFLWVSTAAAEQIKSFATRYLNGAANHHFAQDSRYQFDGWFGYSVAPTILVFDAGGYLKKTFNNEVATDLILAALQ